MGAGCVESLVLEWLGRLPTVPVPLLGTGHRCGRGKTGQYQGAAKKGDFPIEPGNGRLIWTNSG